MAQQPAFLLIDSTDRISGNSHSFTIQLQPGIMQPKTVTLKYVSIPLTNFTVSSSNNVIYFGGYTATITPGVYDYISIATAVKNAMEATAYAGTITVTYDTLTYLFTISGTVAFTLDFGTNTTNSMAYLLGYDEVDVVSATSHTADSVAHLSIPQFIMIDITGLPQSTFTSNGEHCNFIIPTNNISGYQNYFFETSQYTLSFPGGHTSIQYFNVRLFSRGSQDFDLRGVDWQCLLNFSY